MTDSPRTNQGLPGLLLGILRRLFSREGGPSPRGGRVSAREGASAGVGLNAHRGSSWPRVRGTESDYRAEVRTALSAVQITDTIIRRGVRLYEKGAVYQNETSPWLFVVESESADTPYKIDLTVPSCTCPYYEYSGRVCKHVVAAAAQFGKEDA